MPSVFKNLSKNHKKGENGCVLVIGGSPTYSGAPAFSALASLRSGAELVYILADMAAQNALKNIYDAIIMPFEYDEHILSKVTTCIIGPGLGRPTEESLRTIQSVLAFLAERKVPIVVDGDGIHYYKQGMFKEFETCVVTPNESEAQDLEVETGHTYVFKGQQDVIRTEKADKRVESKGTKKRCGGQGDILAGIIATGLSLSKDSPAEVCQECCTLLRRASRKTFKRLGFSMTASDILVDIPKVLRKLAR